MPTFDALFADLESFLPGLLREVMEHQAKGPARLPIEGPFPVALQERIGREVMGLIGFDFAHGRLDVSHHPFTGGVPDDSRITTRYDEADFTESLMAVIHETGHSLYERGLPAEWRSQPVGRAQCHWRPRLPPRAPAARVLPPASDEARSSRAVLG